MILILFIFLLFAAGIFYIAKHPQFGRKPSGQRLKRILKSPHFKGGAFQNIHPTPQLAEETNMGKVMFRFLFGKAPRKKPTQNFNFRFANRWRRCRR